MDNKRMNYRDGGEVGMFNILPFELCLQILSLLPVQSLLVLRAVCKWLISVIDDPEFASFHLRHFPDNVLETRFLNIQMYDFKPAKNLCYVVSLMISSSNHPVITDHFYFLDEESKEHSLQINCSLDSLVLLTDILRHHAILWNPSIRRLRRLPFPSTELHHHYVLGHHTSCNDYKVVAICYNGDEAWAYSVRSGSWTCLTFDASSFGNTCLDHSDVLSFNDGVVWVREEGCWYDDPSRNLSFVWFEFGTERFCCADDLADMRPKETYCRLMRLDGGATAGLCAYDAENQPSIWALQTQTMSWIKRYKISREMMQLNYNMNVVERNGELLWKYNDGVVSYNIETQVIKIHKMFSPHCNRVYIESLFMLH